MAVIQQGWLLYIGELLTEDRPLMVDFHLDQTIQLQAQFEIVITRRIMMLTVNYDYIDHISGTVEPPNIRRFWEQPF